MNSAHQRYVKFLELQLATSQHDPSGKPYDLMQLLVGVQNEKFPLKKPRKGQKQVKRPQDIKKFVHDGVEHVVLLWSSVDADAIATCYQHLHTAEMEKTVKKDDFGDRREAHLVIRMQPEKKGRFQVFPMALEESLGLGASTVGAQLVSMLGKVGARRHVDKTGNVHKFSPDVQIKGLLARDLFEQLEKSGIEGFTLVKDYIKHGDFDKPAELVSERQVLELSVVGERNKGWLQRLIKSAKGQADSGGYETVRVHYFDSKANKPKSATLEELSETVTGQKAEQLFSRGCRISLDEPMDHDHQTVVPAFAKLMAEKLQEEFYG